MGEKKEADKRRAADDAVVSKTPSITYFFTDTPAGAGSTLGIFALKTQVASVALFKKIAQHFGELGSEFSN